jgi:hypothetical protein
MATHGGPKLELKWNQIYKWTEFNDVETFTYDVDNSLAAPAFTRILYIMRIDQYSVWIEMDDFTGGDATKIGVPLTWTYDVEVTNMIVKFKNAENFPETNINTIYNRLTPVTGKINFWPSNYSNSPGFYDHEDTNYASSNGHGSFQFFDMTPATPETIFSWNFWGKSNQTFGFGSRNTSHPDWTFAYNNAQFNKREGNIYVQ